MALKYKSVSSSATSQTIGLDGAKSVSFKNDGTDEVYIRLFETVDPEPSAASGYASTTAYAKLTSSDSALTFNSPNGFRCAAIVCDTAKTATVRVYYL